MIISGVQSLCKLPNPGLAVPVLGSSPFLNNHRTNLSRSLSRDFKHYEDRRFVKGRGIVCGWLIPVDPWAPNVDSQSIASQLFAVSLFPYIGFLYFITKSKSSPKLTLFGFYFLLAFVGATIPAGIYGAESLLTLTNLFIVLGLRQALRKAKDAKETTFSSAPGVKEQKKSTLRK